MLAVASPSTLDAVGNGYDGLVAGFPGLDTTLGLCRCPPPVPRLGGGGAGGGAVMLRFRRLEDLLRWDSMLERCGGVATVGSSGNIVFGSVDEEGGAGLLLSLRPCLLGGGMGLRIVDAGGLCTGVEAE